MFIEWFIETEEYTKEQLENLVKITEKIEPEITEMLNNSIKNGDYAKIPK